MKKSIALLSALCLVFCSACSDDKQEKSSSKAETTTEAITTEAQTEATTTETLADVLQPALVATMAQTFEEQGFNCECNYDKSTDTYTANLSMDGLADKMKTKTQDEINTFATALEAGFVDIQKLIFGNDTAAHLVINFVNENNSKEIYFSYLDGKLQ